MIQVTRERFFAVIGPMDVHPRPGSLKGRYWDSTWETPGRVIVGRSVSDSHGSDAREYYLAPAYAEGRT